MPALLKHIETEGSKLLPDRQTDKWSDREDGQTPTAAFCPNCAAKWGRHDTANMAAYTICLCAHLKKWPQTQAKVTTGHQKEQAEM